MYCRIEGFANINVFIHILIHGAEEGRVERRIEIGAVHCVKGRLVLIQWGHINTILKSGGNLREIVLQLEHEERRRGATVW